MFNVFGRSGWVVGKYWYVLVILTVFDWVVSALDCVVSSITVRDPTFYLWFSDLFSTGVYEFRMCDSSWGDPVQLMGHPEIREQRTLHLPMKAFAFCTSLVSVIVTMPFPGWHDVSPHTNVRLYPGTAHSSLSFRTTQPAALISGSFLMFLGGPSGERSATIRFCVGDDPALEFGGQVALQHPVPAQSRSSSNQIDERTTPCFFAFLGCETLRDSSLVLGILKSVICPENMLFFEGIISLFVLSLSILIIIDLVYPTCHKM